ncbi:MAG: phenylalanine--tRNA ligase subunit beta [Candidatus Woesearchaeota archaeon]
MPTVTLNKKVFDKLIGKKLPIDQIKDRISMLGTDLEDINDNEIVVEVFPNRPDMLSEQGFARAFSSFIGVKKGLRDYPVKKGNYKVIVESSVKDIRPYTTCAVVKNIKFDDDKIKEIIQIQEKLHITYGRNRKRCAIGVYPMEKICFPIRYLARNPSEIRFIPLEFSRELNGHQILSTHPTGRDYGHLLEGKKKFPIFEDAEGRILSMPPIINSQETGKIGEETTDIFIEVSGFDFNVQQKCLNILVTALYEMGGHIYSVNVSYGSKKYNTPDLTPEKMKLKIEYVNNLLGLDLKEKDIKLNLEKMGFGFSKGIALIPPYRADILHPIDLVEDIAIAYGYENFKEEIPHVNTVGEEDPFEVFKQNISKILVGLGLLEVSTYHLSKKENFNNKMLINSNCIDLENSKSIEYTSLRSWMLPCLLEVLDNNKHYEYPQKIFDLGIVFKENHEFETNVEEFERLAVAVCHEKADFTTIKKILDYLMRMLDLEYEIEETEHNSFIEGRVGRVIVNGKKVAYIGELHPEVLENWNLEYPVAGFELNVTDLFRIFSK